MLRHFARAVAHRWRLPDDFHEALSVIVTELVSNAVLHSGSPWVAVAIKVRGNTLTTQVRDGGRWKHRPVRRQEPLDAHADCGHGLRLVESFAARTSTRTLEAGSVVVAEIVMPAHYGGPSTQPRRSPKVRVRSAALSPSRTPRGGSWPAPDTSRR